MSEVPLPESALATEPAMVRRRTVVVVGCALVTSLALAGMLTFLPLHAVRELALDSTRYAYVLSLRMAGITLGVIVLGAISDRWGVRRVTFGCLLVAAGALALLAPAPFWLFLILVPLISATLSTSFVNLSFLTQIADVDRPGRVNTWYRALASVGGIAAPLLVTRLTDNMTWPMLGIAGGLGVTAFWVRLYPRDEPPVRFLGWAAEGRALLRTYTLGLTNRELMRLLALTLSIASLLMVLDAFFAIRLTTELRAPPAVYGSAVALGSGAGLAGVLLLGTVLDRWPLRFILGPLYGVAALSLLALGLTRSVPLNVGLFVICVAAGQTAFGPFSIWLSRAATPGAMNSAFALQKVLIALSLGLASVLFGRLVQPLGISLLFVVCGAAALGLAGLLALLPEPALPRPGPESPPGADTAQ